MLVISLIAVRMIVRIIRIVGEVNTLKEEGTPREKTGASLDSEACPPNNSPSS